MKNYSLPANSYELGAELYNILDAAGDPKRKNEILQPDGMLRDRQWDILFLAQMTLEKLRSVIPETLDKVYGESLIMLRQAEIFAEHQATK